MPPSYLCLYLYISKHFASEKRNNRLDGPVSALLIVSVAIDGGLQDIVQQLKSTVPMKVLLAHLLILDSELESLGSRGLQRVVEPYDATCLQPTCFTINQHPKLVTILCFEMWRLALESTPDAR